MASVLIALTFCAGATGSMSAIWSCPFGYAKDTPVEYPVPENRPLDLFHRDLNAECGEVAVEDAGVVAFVLAMGLLRYPS